MKNTVLFLFLIFSLSIQAQRTAPGMRNMKTFTNLNRFFKREIPKYQNRQAKDEAKSYVEKNIGRISKLLFWSDKGGVLLRVYAQRNTLSGAIIYHEPVIIGYGLEPVDAIINNLDSNQFKISHPESFTVKDAPKKNFSIWVTAKKSKNKIQKLKYGYIDEIFNNQISKEALLKLSSDDLKFNILHNRRVNIIKGIMNNLEKKISDAQSFQDIVALKNDLIVKEKNVRNLKVELNKNLAEIERINNTLSTLQSLDQILSVSSMILQVNASLKGINRDLISKQKKSEDIVTIVQDYKIEKKNSVVQFQSQITIENGKLNKIKTNLFQKFKENNVPNDINQEVFSNKFD